MRDSAQVYRDGDAECDRPRSGVALPGVLAVDKTSPAPLRHTWRRTQARCRNRSLFSSFKFHFDVMVRHTGVATVAFHSRGGA